MESILSLSSESTSIDLNYIIALVRIFSEYLYNLY